MADASPITSRLTPADQVLSGYLKDQHTLVLARMVAQPRGLVNTPATLTRQPSICLVHDTYMVHTCTLHGPYMVPMVYPNPPHPAISMYRSCAYHVPIMCLSWCYRDRGGWGLTGTLNRVRYPQAHKRGVK